MSKDKTNRLHADWLHEQLQDPEFAAEYLTAATEDPEPTVYLTALRHVVEARGVARIAKTSGVPRESVYRALSEKGNPRWDTLAAILKAVGMRLVVASSAPARRRSGKKVATA